MKGIFKEGDKSWALLDRCVVLIFSLCATLSELLSTQMVD